MITATEQATIDDRAKGIGLMVGIPNELYMWTVSRYSTLYMEYINGEWIAWRETYRDDYSTCTNHKHIARSHDFGATLHNVRRYIRYVKQHREVWQ